MSNGEMMFCWYHCYLCGVGGEGGGEEGEGLQMGMSD